MALEELENSFRESQTATTVTESSLLISALAKATNENPLYIPHSNAIRLN